MGTQSNSTVDVAATPRRLHGAACRDNASRTGPKLAIDHCNIRNERMKLAGGFLNAVGLTLIVFALLRPITQDLSLLTPVSFVWVALGVVFTLLRTASWAGSAKPETGDR